MPQEKKRFECYPIIKEDNPLMKLPGMQSDPLVVKIMMDDGEETAGLLYCEIYRNGKLIARAGI